jgi:hypothetical protein
MHTILRLPAVKARTGLSRSTLYARMARGQFPAQVALGPPRRGVAGGRGERLAGPAYRRRKGGEPKPCLTSRTSYALRVLS